MAREDEVTTNRCLKWPEGLLNAAPEGLVLEEEGEDGYRDGRRGMKKRARG